VELSANPTVGIVPQKVGPFMLGRVIATGGMGVVHAATHERTGEAVAIKTLRSSAPTVLSAIRREIHALQRLTHPAIVRILDHGVVGGVPWYAMELLHGVTLRQQLQSAYPLLGDRVNVTDHAAATITGPVAPARSERRPRLSVQRAGPAMRRALLGVLHGACRGLSHVHASGIVHRDLKPENIFVRGDGSPVLVDFGIAARFGGALGGEVLDANSSMIGTIGYMAPEQLRGELVDARADLYSLGCVLYECLTGAPPFAELPLSILMDAHLLREPTPPSRFADDVSPELDQLVLKLLAKEPRDRLGYVDDVADVLESVAPDFCHSEGRKATSRYTYRPPFVGREDDRRRLSEAIRRLLREGKGGQLYLTGESGVGKTRLAMEALTEATRERLSVALSACGVDGAHDDSLPEPPLAAFAPALLAVVDHCRAQGSSESHRLFGPRGRILAMYQPVIATLPEYRDFAQPAELVGSAAGLRVRAALLETLLAFAEVKPCVLLIDDLHWADALSVACLTDLLESSPAAPGLLIIGTLRAEEATPALRRLLKASGDDALSLGRFSDREVSVMAQGMLGVPKLPAAMLGFLHEQSGGNPFFVLEHLRAAIDAGVLARAGTAGWHVACAESALAQALASQLPNSLTTLFERRFRDLDDTARALLRGAAVLGRELDGDVLIEWSGLPTSVALDLLDELRRRQILEEGRAGQLRFTHDRMRTALYEALDEHELVGLHRRAAELLERYLAPKPGFAQLAALGLHWSRARVPAKARGYFHGSAERAKSLYAHADATALYQACLREAELESEDALGQVEGAVAPTGPIHEALGEIHSWLGKRDEAKAAYDKALVQANSVQERSRLWRRIGKTYETQHLHDQALRAYEDAEAALGEPAEAANDDWWAQWIGLQIDRVMVHYWLAREAEVARLVESIRAVVNERGTAQQRAQLFKGLAYMNLRRERYVLSARTVGYAEQRLEASQDWGDEGEVLEARFMLGMARLCNGALERAEQEMADALPEAERRGDVTILSRFLAYLMLAKRLQRELRGTRQSAERCLAVAKDAGIREYIGAAHANLAWVAWRECEPESLELARQHCSAALADWQSISFVYPFEWMARLVLIALEIRAGHADALREQALSMLDPKQQLLPEALQRALTALGKADSAALAASHGAAVVALAEQAGFL
jgi:serine/threonine protein kinase/tetratricopeptide (TPR) repeat protein